MVLRESYMGQSELGIEPRSLLVILPALFQRPRRRELPFVMTRLQKSLICSHGRRICPCAFRTADELSLENRGNRRGDFILHGEDIGKFPVVTLRPQLKSVGRTD